MSMNRAWLQPLRGGRVLPVGSRSARSAFFSRPKNAMPTYEYRCQKCHQVFEAVQSMKDPRFTTCPEALCKNAEGWGHGEVTRLLGTGAGLIFKGSGFYITDYRSEGYKEAAKKDAPAAPAKSDGGASSGGSDKTAATPAAPAKSGGDSGSGGGSGAKGAAPAGGSSSSSPPAT